MSKQLVWLVTGTSSGFGKELCLALLERGDKVISTARARSISKLNELKEKGAATLELDVTASLSELHAAAAKAIAIYGHIDVVVNNAGYIISGALEENTPEQTYEQFNTNVFGGLNVARAFLPYMRPRKTGTIVWIGSLGGYSGLGGAGLYCATKYAVRCISETLHEEISPLGLRSLIFEPGYFRTDLLTTDNRANYGGNIPDYEPIVRARKEGLDAYNLNQPGDPKKGVNVMIDVVKGEGAAKEKEFTPVVLLGSDCYNGVRNILTGAVAKFDEWKEISISTDRDDL